MEKTVTAMDIAVALHHDEMQSSVVEKCAEQKTGQKEVKDYLVYGSQYDAFLNMGTKAPVKSSGHKYSFSETRYVFNKDHPVRNDVFILRSVSVRNGKGYVSADEKEKRTEKNFDFELMEFVFDYKVGVDRPPFSNRPREIWRRCWMTVNLDRNLLANGVAVACDITANEKADYKSNPDYHPKFDALSMAKGLRELFTLSNDNLDTYYDESVETNESAEMP